jgi:exopolyphosphatase/guanosine-5'-triphosphate,3'-diphosphate pyrophosphatase
MEKQIGIIDLGSNSIRLVIYKIGIHGSYKLVDDISDNARLSESMVDGKDLNPTAMKRAIKSIKLFKSLCHSYNIYAKDIICVATAAVRKANNKEFFLDLLKEETGLDFKLISGEEEALYTYNAVIHSIDIESGLVIDIGGGSTELVHFVNKEVINYISIPIGSIVATEEFTGSDKIAAAAIKSLESHLDERLEECPWLSELKSLSIIGLGGTIRSISKIHKAQIEYPIDIIHNYEISAEDFYSIYNNLKSLDLSERKHVKGISIKRSDILVGGLSILNYIFRKTSSEKLVISGSGLREGILFDHLKTANSHIYCSDVLGRSINNCIDIYDLQKEHAEHVSNISLSLFDQLSSLHGMSYSERKLLKVASLLHDIGITVSYYGHSLHAFYLIMNSRINGLTHKETLLVASIAASHGKNSLKKEWLTEYKSLLSPNDLKTINKLSVILKLSECLDRSETRVIKAVECIIDKENVRLKAISRSKPEIELSTAAENAEEFKKMFKRNLLIL